MINAVIVNFMLVMLGALTTSAADGRWELVVLGCLSMIAGNLGLWNMKS